MKDHECAAYINTYKCPGKTCEDCMYRLPENEVKTSDALDVKVSTLTLEQEIRQKVLDEFIANINEYVESTEEAIQEGDCSSEQRAYLSGLKVGLRLANEMKEGK